MEIPSIDKIHEADQWICEQGQGVFPVTTGRDTAIQTIVPVNQVAHIRLELMAVEKNVMNGKVDMATVRLYRCSFRVLEWKRSKARAVHNHCDRGS